MKGYELDEADLIDSKKYRVTIAEGFIKLKFLFNSFDKATEFVQTALETAENDIEVVIAKVNLEKEKKEKENEENTPFS